MQNSEDLNGNSVLPVSNQRRESNDEYIKPSITNAQSAQGTSVNSFSTSLSIARTTPVKQQQFHLIEGVWLSERGLHQIKSLALELPKRTRMKRGARQALLNQQGISPSRTEDNEELPKEDDAGSFEDKLNEENNIPKIEGA